MNSNEPHKNDPLELATLISVTDGNLAEILKLALADEEIESAIEGEHQAGLTGVFKIRVLVPKKDLKRAEEILHRHAGEDTQDIATDPDAGEL
jgi:hypothetical protein